jgi:uncharacterized protein
MKKTINVLLIVASLTMGLATVCLADLYKGKRAARNGDFSTAFREWRPLAEGGNTEAQFLLAHLYYYGDGRPKNFSVARKWYHRAAVEGHAGAQNRLGDMFEKGQGVPSDFTTAIRWYRYAAEQRHGEAQTNLGYMYASGKGVAADNEIAYMWAILADRNGNKFGRKLQRIIQKKMSTSQIERAKNLARACIEKDYTGC